MYKYWPRLLAALAAYSLPAALGLAAVALGCPWVACVSVWLGLATTTLLVLAFSVPPLPAHPKTLREMDFAAIAWLPHAAVTRLPEEGLRHRATRRIRQRLAWSFSVLVAGNATVCLALAHGPGMGSPATWCTCLAVACGALVWIGLVGRERLLARGVPPVGTDIG
ncbi:MAG: hypothetical protein R3F49_02695 [Planctomycetota bacterium]